MKCVAVVGAGQMGVGIAHVCLASGFKVTLVDQSDDQLLKASSRLKEKIPEHFQHLDVAKVCPFKNSDIVIEAIAENLEVKKVFWRDAEALPHAILASNTSSYSITEIASFTKSPGQFIGIHFMNPVPKMSIVEVIQGEQTSKETYEQSMNFVKSLSKNPVAVKDSPGFIVNRILIPMVNEAILLLEKNLASVEDIDAAMKGAAGYPMGPLTLADFIGLDTCLAIMKDLQSRLGEKYKPSALLETYVREGKLGKKSGQGFYTYSG